MVEIIVTLLMLAVVIFGVIKKFHAVTLFTTVGWVVLIGWSLITGNSVLGEATKGNAILDVFELTFEIMKTQITGTIMISGTILAYMAFMKKIGASQAFTVLLSKPMSKIKQPYILLALLVIVVAFMKLVVPSAISVVALLFAILFPIFAKLGCSYPSIVSAFILGTTITWGPADAGVALTASLVGEASVADFFMNTQFIPCICEMVVMAITFVIVSIIFDRKDKVGKTELTEEQLKKQAEAQAVNVPMYYAILPLLPLFLILLFSGKIFPITLNTVPVVIISLLIAVVVYLLSNIGKKKGALKDIDAFMHEFGSFVGRMGFLIVGANVFAKAINTIKGMDMLIEALNSLGGGASVILVVVGVLLALVVVAATGTYTANLNVFVPFMTSVATVSGMSAAALGQLANMACGMGTGLAPVSGTLLFLSGETGVPFTTILKRNIIPILAAAATGIVVVLLFYA